VKAERFASEAEAAHADVISVRATHLMGFIALRSGSYHEALLLFRIAQEAYWLCRYRDRELIEMITYEVSVLEVHLRSKAVAGTQASSARRRVHDPWETDVPPSDRIIQTLAMDAWLYALDGDNRNAYRLMRRACAVTTDPAWRVWIHANHAALAAAIGEDVAAGDLATIAFELVDSVRWNERNDERVGLLLLAEVAAKTHPEHAREILAQYETLPPIDAALVLHGDARLEALHASVRGAVAQAVGRPDEAYEHFSVASKTWSQIGGVWRSARALLDCASTGMSESAAQAFAKAREIIRTHVPRSFLARRAGLLIESDPIAKSIPPARREILALVLEGYDLPEIARATNRSYHTVRNHLTSLRETFEAHSIPELIVQCARRGWVGPSPSDIHNEQSDARQRRGHLA
jgi:DNA-binding CsgD family transcriptional regulator